MREHSLVKRLAGETDFRWRGEEITRLEGFSDAVFAFAVTLLVVSLEVPKTFGDLMEAMRGFAAFGVCFALLSQIWFGHYRFFRRYGLQDPWAVFLNCVLLFFAVFFVYPLKFLAVSIFANGGVMDAGEARPLFAVYGSGFAAVFLVFTLLYLHAWKMRDELALNDLERLKTREGTINNLAMTVVGLVSIALALSLPLGWVSLAGYIYFLVAAYFWVAGTMFGKKARRLKERLSAATAIPTAEEESAPTELEAELSSAEDENAPSGLLE
ncbi:MAG: TMEM175 family protein [Terracidiphilus sp.]|jgi:uncharacterized membrane protein